MVEETIHYNKDRVSVTLRWLLLAVVIVTFGLLAYMTKVTYQTVPPQPERFVTESGETIMTSGDLYVGKAGFQRANLMDYGSLYGMGSYLGEDFTAKYLKELGMKTRENIALARYGVSYDALDETGKWTADTAMKRMLQGVDLTQREVTLPDPLARAVVSTREEIAVSLLSDDLARGYSRAKSLDEVSAGETGNFLLYSSLTTVARRPNSDVSWTQNWPPEPLVDNHPSASTFMWTWASFCFTFLGFGLVIYIFERYLSRRDDAEKESILENPLPLTPSQKRTGKYFLVVAAVFLVQLGVGALMAHYYSERTSFYGFDIGKWLPFNFLRDLHIQTPIVWIGLSWIGAALFLAPAIAGREAKYQGFLVSTLFWVTLFVVAGAIVGDYLGLMNVIRDSWFWFGNQGLSYLELGRAWQIGFFGGLLIWSALVLRALWPSWDRLKIAAKEFWTGNIRLENLLWASTLNIALLYACGMVPLTGIEKSFSLTDFWRWWVVHLWVEQSFEFFTVAVSAYLLMATGLVSRLLAERTVYFELILIFLGGVLGTGHHFYWVGGPGMWIPLGSMFSFIEVLPLVLLITESIEQYRTIKGHREFKYHLAYLYIIGAAFWNFVGAGVFGGGLINAPLVNYYEHATFLTLNHAHTALFGAFGLLALGLIYFCLRYAAGDKWSFDERIGRWAFWMYNGGLVLWILLNFFPIGWPQLLASYEHGLAYARSLEFYDTTTLWQWLRFPGDVVFALGAVLMAYDFLRKLKPFFAKEEA
jgi:nitric oxide reductase subunit B